MDISNLGIAGVGAVTVICVLIGALAKASPIDNKWIPCICGASGGLLGLIWFLFGYPGFPAEDPFTAAAVGIVSGLAATGAHQVIHQQKKKG